MFENVTIVIPSYKPDEKLISTVRGVREAGFSDVVVVDDGGGEKYSEYFKRVESEFGCTVLTHEINRGKGAALKTAFKYYIENRPNSAGLVTADADGQHLPSDMVTVAEQMTSTESVVLGCRDFSEPQVPPRSKAGNRITSVVFKAFLGMKISDTQTGLRGIPRKYVGVLSEADGDRYEYETHMLFLMKREGIPFTEVKIRTVYIDENSSSHFRVIHDSMRIYELMIRFALSSIICTVIDVVGLCLLIGALESTEPIFVSFAAAALCARLASAVINYLVNNSAVFKAKLSASSFGKYLLFAVPRAVISALIVGLAGVLSFPIAGTVALHVLLSLLLFTTSFRLQYVKIFK